MSELLTAAQMRSLEQAAIASGEVTGLELMERAGRGVVEAIFEEWPELAKTSHKAVVLCGPGNNGGDGFVAARLLKEWGWEVEVFLYGDPDKLPPDAHTNFRRCPVEIRLNEDWWEPESWEAVLIVDAIFGIGRIRQPTGIIQTALAVLGNGATEDHWVVAIDLPSGLCANSGKPLFRFETGESYAAIADLAVTFHMGKTGLYLDEGPQWARRHVIKDIGLPPRDPFKRGDCYASVPQSVSLAGFAEIPDARDKAGLADRETDCLQKFPVWHKFSHGHALILSGPSGKGGAARLAARGALRIGAGLVSVGCPPDTVSENAAQMNAIMLEAVHDGDALARVLEDTRINALCLGPGLGQARAREMVPVALGAGRACVLDADALTAFEGDPAVLFEMLHETCVLTPHAGEFARLFPDIAAKLAAPATKGPAYSKVEAAREAATRAGCVVLYKGADTVIAAPDGRCSINSAAYERSAPWLATAGSGDVLAGFITGLLARGFDPMQAAETAAWLHVECALSFGPGLIAEDLPEELPKVFRSLDI